MAGQPPALDIIVASSVYIIHIFPCHFPGTFHALPIFRDKTVTNGRFPCKWNPSISKLLQSIGHNYSVKLPQC